jgi:D-sedoheptulose 7-phosphate isomerase
MMKSLIEQHIQQSIDTKQAILASTGLQDAIIATAEACKRSLQNQGKILIAGNGGSASDAHHFAAELVGRFEKQRPGMAAIALSSDTSGITAIANDFGYDNIFARQIECIGAAQDIFIGISTSGDSTNIISAVEAAKKKA